MGSQRVYRTEQLTLSLILYSIILSTIEINTNNYAMYYFHDSNLFLFDKINFLKKLLSLKNNVYFLFESYNFLSVFFVVAAVFVYILLFSHMKSICILVVLKI